MTYDDRHQARRTGSRQPPRADVAAQDDEDDEYAYSDEVYPSRQPTSSRRYQTSGPLPATSYEKPPLAIPRRTSSMGAPPTTSRRLERDPLATRVLPRRRRRVGAAAHQRGSGHAHLAAGVAGPLVFGYLVAGASG